MVSSIHPDAGLTFESLVSIAIDGVPDIANIGLIIFASAEGHLDARNAMLVNALAPFVVISVLGLLLMVIAPAAPLE